MTWAQFNTKPEFKKYSSLFVDLNGLFVELIMYRVRSQNPDKLISFFKLYITILRL